VRVAWRRSGERWQSRQDERRAGDTAQQQPPRLAQRFVHAGARRLPRIAPAPCHAAAGRHSFRTKLNLPPIRFLGPSLLSCHPSITAQPRRPDALLSLCAHAARRNGSGDELPGRGDPGEGIRSLLSLSLSAASLAARRGRPARRSARRRQIDDVWRRRRSEFRAAHAQLGASRGVRNGWQCVAVAVSCKDEAHVLAVRRRRRRPWGTHECYWLT